MCKVTVIIPTFNRPESLAQAVDSVLAQELEHVEILIIDDHSEELNWKQVEQLRDCYDQIQLFRNKSRIGAGASRNRGLNQATGEFLLFLDDDDILLPHMIQRSLVEIEKNRVDIVSCRSSVKGKGLSAIKLKRFNRQQTDSFSIYPMHINPVEHICLYAPQIHTFLIRKSAIQQVRFNERLRYGEDTDFWLTLATQGSSFQKLDFVGCEYQINPLGSSQLVNFWDKKSFYIELIKSMKENKIVKNLCFIKLMFLSRHRLESTKWLAKALGSPRLLYRHLKYYLEANWSFKF